MSRVQLADAHLTYISNPYGQSRYDVHRRDERGRVRWPCLGSVERHGRMWAAISVGDGLTAIGDTRWQAAIAAWPEGHDPCPMGCGGKTEDPYGGPCKACWEAVYEPPSRGRSISS